MADRPILFSAPMVRALLAGTKTQTRRVVKPQPSPELLADYAEIRVTRGSTRTDAQALSECLPCPYGQPGTKLWVRETWAPNTVQPLEHRPPADYLYAATDSARYAVCRWRPSIHMPRAASRITLEITGVRVERLQDISEADAQAEGCPVECMTPTGDDSGSAIHGPGGYLALWESINGPGSWAANPWVWVVEFKRVEVPIRQASEPAAPVEGG